MTCMAIAEIRLKSIEALMEYAGQAGPIIAKHGGEFVFHGRNSEVVCGTSSAQLVTILRFANIDKARAWYYSPEYQALLPTRDRGADETIVFYEENPAPVPAAQA